MDAAALILEDRAVLAVAGADRVAFLQGLISNDVEKAAGGRALWAAFLTPQGKYLHDFLLAPDGERLLLDLEAARLEDLKRRLTIYRLRSKVTLQASDEVVAVAWGATALEALGLPAEPGAVADFRGGVAFVDPRDAALGARLLLPRSAAAEALSGFRHGDRADWDALRIGLGIPEGSRDLEVEKALLLENGFDELRGVDWDKGCWMGQELTARTKYRALIKRRLLPVRIEGETPAAGTPVLQGKHEVGELRSGAGGVALALLRLDALAKPEPLTAGGLILTPQPPAWLALPQPA